MSMSGGQPKPIKETGEERASAATAVKQWNRYQKVFAPLEDRLAATVRVNPAKQAAAEGNAAVASEQQFSNARDELAGRLEHSGFNPASAGFRERMGDLNTNDALATGLNVARTDQQLSDNQAYGLLGFTQLGQGEPATAINLGGNAARSAQSQAESDARAALQKSIANNQLIGSVVGAGTAAATGGLRTGAASSPESAGMSGLDTQAWDNSGMNYQLGNASGGGLSY